MTQQKTFLVADTETTGLGNYSLVFDFAYVIATRTRTIIERNFVIRDIITNPKIMLAALRNEDWRDKFGGKKIFRHYIPGLADGSLNLCNWDDVIATLREDINTYNVSVFCAYNLPFDSKALGQTMAHLRGRQKVLAAKIDELDLYYFSCVTICNTRLYHEVAHRMGEDAGWITSAGNVRTTAEKVYAYLSGEFNFVESHTALEDAQIETEILQRLLARKKIIPYNVRRYMPWTHAQRILGKLF